MANTPFLPPPILTKEESAINIETIPIRENTSFSGYILDYYYLDNFCEQSGLDYKSAISIISENHNIPECLVLVSVPEYIIIENSNLVNEIDQVIISPLSEKDSISLCIESYYNDFFETLDEQAFEDKIYALCEKYFEPSSAKKVARALQTVGVGTMAYGIYKNAEPLVRIQTHKIEDWGQPYDDMAKGVHITQAGTIPLLIGSGLEFGTDTLPTIYREYKDAPKTTIAKVIAKLRKTYIKALTKSKQMVDNNKAGILRRLATRIAHVIDKLLLAMQRAAN